MKTIRTILSYLPKSPVVGMLALALVATTATVAMATFGPDRPTKAYTEGVAGFDHVQFNSFTGVPNIGDERNFLTGKIAGADGGFYDPMTKLRDGDEVMMRVYVHNNADDTLNASGVGVAKNVNVKVTLPDSNVTAKSQVASASITADNATPKTITDTLDMSAENNGYFSVDYVDGSAQVTDNQGGTRALPNGDQIVKGGAGVSLGDVQGCFQYVKLVTFKVKVKMPRYTIQKTVRVEGETKNDWREVANVPQAKKAEWRIEFKNIGSNDLKDVNIVDSLPKFTKVVPGSVEVVNPNNPNGFTVADSAIQANGTQLNVGIGSYAPGSNAFVYFLTEQDIAGLKCGTHRLDNTAYATPSGYGAVNDSAAINIELKKCETTTPPTTPPTTTVSTPGKGSPSSLPATGPADAIAGTASISTLAYGVRRWLDSRKALKV